VALTLEQIAIGAVLGLGLQFATTALSIFGYLSASQTSLAMAMLNDPVHGSSSDALSVLALLLGMLLFFALWTCTCCWPASSRPASTPGRWARA
jgi:flagellar biosynthetic protein FliR